MNLYELTHEYTTACSELAELLESGEIDQQTLDDTTQALGSELREKAINVAKYTEGLKADIDAISEAVKRLGERKKVLSNQRDRLIDYLKSNMEAAGMTKIDDAILPMSIKKNPPSVVLDVAIDELPDQFVKVTKSADKTELKKAIKAGECEYAHLDTSTRLAIG